MKTNKKSYCYGWPKVVSIKIIYGKIVKGILLIIIVTIIVKMFDAYSLPQSQQNGNDYIVFQCPSPSNPDEPVAKYDAEKQLPYPPVLSGPSSIFPPSATDELKIKLG